MLTIRRSRVPAGTHAYEEELGGSCGHTGVHVPSTGRECVTRSTTILEVRDPVTALERFEPQGREDVSP